MRRIKDYKLQHKMILYIISATTLIFVAMISLNGYNSSQLINTNSNKLVRETTDKLALQCETFLGHGVDVARTVAYTYEGMLINGTPNREVGIAIMKSILEQNPTILGLWTVWEPNAFDGNDLLYINKQGHDKTGRFVPYCNRFGNSIAIEACTDYDNPGEAGNYYSIPMRTGIEYIGEPYTYKVQGNDINMISIAIPIRVKDKIVGVAGIDISSETLITYQSKIKLYNTGFAKIITNRGTIVADVDKSEIGKKSGEWQNDKLTDIRQAITEGKAISKTTYSDHFDAMAIKCYSPISIGKTNTPWTFVSIVNTEEAQSEGLKALYQTIFTGIIGIVLLIILILLIARIITRPLIQAVGFAKRIASGDLTIQLKIEALDEIGELQQSLNNMAHSIKSMIQKVSESSNKIVSISSQFNEAARQFASGANQQAASVEEVSASVEEILSTVNQNSDNAFQANKIAATASVSIKDNSSTISASVKAMKQIAGKISIIGDIAFQTNILALNAAVEAARAGEHGKGFAVVAAEVRKLAEHSKIAAEEIDKITRGGVKTAEEAGLQFEALVPEIDRTASLVGEISAASNEQSAGIQQINSAILQLNDVTQSNASTSEEMATTAEELLKLSNELNEIIKLFNIGDLLYQRKH